MTYAPTVEYLRSQALAAGAASFWHGKQQTQSINYHAAFPQAHLFLMPAPLVQVNDALNVQYRAVLAFYGKDEHEHASNLAAPEAADQSLAIQEAMDRLSQQFVAGLLDDGQFDVGDTVDRAPVLREGSQVGTGFLITLTLTCRAAVC